MAKQVKPKLNPKKKYLQVALNNTLQEAEEIIKILPKNERIIVEAGTPFIKRYGEEGIRKIKQWYMRHLIGSPFEKFSMPISSKAPAFQGALWSILQELEKGSGNSVQKTRTENLPTVSDSLSHISPYVVADLKTMDRGETEVKMAARAGASAAVALGIAPTETLDAFIDACEKEGIDPMIDMMNVDFPLAVLRKLKKIPPVVILHRGVDEEHFNREKQLPLHEIRRLKGNYNIMISVAGGDTLREVQSSVFNDADIVVIWKSVFESHTNTASLIEGFLEQVK